MSAAYPGSASAPHGRRLSAGGPVRWVALLLLCAAYLQGGLVKLLDFSGAVGEMQHFGLAPAPLFAAGVIVLELGASAGASRPAVYRAIDVSSEIVACLKVAGHIGHRVTVVASFVDSRLERTEPVAIRSCKMLAKESSGIMFGIS